MYAEGIADLNEMIMLLPICPPNEKDAKIAQIKEKTTNRYLLVFENVSGLFGIWGTALRGQEPKRVPWHSWGTDRHFQ